MKELFCDWILSCVLSVAPVTALPDLYYGTMLYDYYQDDYQQALLDTLIVERRGALGEDPVRFELAKGSFAFADGMYAMAEQTFNSVAAGELKPLDKMRLSFHLARENLRRQDWDGVQRNIANIDLGKSWLGRERIHPEVEFMRAELATVRGDYVAAQVAIDRIDPKQPMRAYALFNLGVAQRSAGALDAAAAAFATLGTMNAYTEDALDLKQRALVALSLVNRQRTQSASAESILGGMPAAGRYRDLALMSYGGLAMDNGDYKLAAQIWLTLGKEGQWSESSATAQLAFPMSLEHMASRELALTHYRAAEQNFENRLASLKTISAQADDPVWVGGLLKVFSQPDGAGDDDAASNVLDEWRRTLGHTDWLEWLAAEDVHELLLQWRELHAMGDWLGLLRDELTTFDALAAEQRRRAALAREMIDSTSLRTRRDQAAVTLAELQQRINYLKHTTPENATGWMLVLAEPEQTKLLENLAAKRAFLERAPDDAAPLLARIDRLEGLVFWQLVDARPNRIRAAQKEALQIGGVLAEIDTTLGRIARAEESLVAGVETNFLQFQERADAITAKVELAIADRETRLADQIRAGIRGEMTQVERQLLVTRIAIARATDQLALDRTSVDGP